MTCKAPEMSGFDSDVISNRDLNTVCRTCLRKDGIISLFSGKVSETGYTLQEKIMAFAYVEILAGDGYPSKICRACFTQLNRAFQFKAQCEYADLFLKQHCRNAKAMAMDEPGEPQLNEAAEEIVDDFIAQNVVGETVGDAEDFLEDQVAGFSADSTGNSDKMKVFYPQIKLSKKSEQVKNSADSSKISKKNVSSGTHNQVDGQDGALDQFGLSSTKEVFACNLCDKTCDTRGSLVSHLQKEHEPSGEFPCSYCGRAFSQELLLTMHVKSHTAERPFCCTICGKGFMEASGLKSHRRCHRKDKKRLCTHCGKFYADKTEHLCQVINPSKEKTHPCNICGKKFMRVSTLTTHKKRHRVVERFRCGTCSKPFFSRHELERHTNVHLGIRPFACSFQDCEHTFYTQGELNRHKKYHLGEKKFKCDQCSLAFYESGHLTNHKRKHTGERPYACELCPKSFTDSSKLKRHVNTTHYNIPRSSSEQSVGMSNAIRETHA